MAELSGCSSGLVNISSVIYGKLRAASTLLCFYAFEIRKHPNIFRLNNAEQVFKINRLRRSGLFRTEIVRVLSKVRLRGLRVTLC